MDSITVNNVPYSVIKLLGKGKGGYSYLAQRDGKQYVVKQIHHEPCSYYTFGNKIEAEQNDYRRLTDARIRIPKMIDLDAENERIVKEYIDGETIFDMVALTSEDEEEVFYQASELVLREFKKLEGVYTSVGLVKITFPVEELVTFDYEG